MEVKIEAIANLESNQGQEISLSTPSYSLTLVSNKTPRTDDMK